MGGWVSCLRAGCVRLGCLRFLVLARLLGGGGVVWSRRPPPLLRSLPSGGWGFGAHASGVGVVGVFAAAALRGQR